MDERDESPPVPRIPLVEEAVATLGATPRVLRALLADLPEARVHDDEGPGTWSAYRVVEHLLHGEETDWMPRVRIILESGESRPFEPFVRDAFGEPGPLDALLEAFARRRSENLVLLRRLGLTEADLDRTGLHPELGRVTLRELLSSWMVHDLGHVRQIARVLAKRPGRHVGPWAAYLPVVREGGGDSGTGARDTGR